MLRSKLPAAVFSGFVETVGDGIPDNTGVPATVLSGVVEAAGDDVPDITSIP